MEYLRTRICIVGSGPAGATASLFLSRYGIEHVLVDKADFPRDKVCGESFDGRVYRILEELFPSCLDDLEQDGQLMKSWCYDFQSDQVTLAVAFPANQLPRISLTRHHLDHFLYTRAAQAATATVRNGQQIRAIEQVPDGIRLRSDGLTVDAELAIWATGAEAWTKPSSSLFLFSRTYYELPAPALEKAKVEIFYFQSPVEGCLLLCPLAGGFCNVEIGIQQRQYKSGGLNMEQLFDAFLAQKPDLQRRFAQGRALGKARGTTMLLNARRQLSDTRLLYCGARAFCVNPVTGLGVGNAMTMGKMAAQLIREQIGEADLGLIVPDKYRRAVKRRFRTISLLNRIVNLAHRYYRRLEPLLAWVLRTELARKMLLRSDLVKSLDRPLQWHDWSSQKEKNSLEKDRPVPASHV